MVSLPVHSFTKENAVNQDIEQMLKQQLRSDSKVLPLEESLEVIVAAVGKLPFALPIGSGRSSFASSKVREAAKRAFKAMGEARFERDRLKEQKRKQAKRSADV